MFNEAVVTSIVAKSAGILRGTVVRLCDDLSVLVARDGRHDDTVSCDVLVTSAADPADLAVGDAVLCWESGRDAERAVLLGRVGPSTVVRPEVDEVPEEV